MRIFWQDKRRLAPALALLMAGTILAETGEKRATAAAVAVIAARKLSDMADEYEQSGDVAHAYLLYCEAAKRDASKAEYSEKRDLLAAVAAVLMRTHLEKPSVKEELNQAVQEAKSQVRAARSAAQNALPPLPTAPEPEIPAKLDEPSPLHFSYKAQALTYGTYSSVRTDSPFNPNNLLAVLPYEDFHLALRPDLSLKYSIFSFSAKPRLDLDRPAQGDGGYTRVYMQEWQARIQPLASLSLSYGREVLMWGPSMSVPASNPFFNDNGRNTPLLEVGGRDFARAIWQPGAHWAFSYIANTRLGRAEKDALPFRKTEAVKADYIGNSLLVSALYSSGINQPFGGGKFIGGYIQKTFGQAVRAYVEGSAQSGSGFTAQLDSPLRPRTIVGGLAYTDLKGGTWTGEYIYNPVGYDSLFASTYFGVVQDSSAAFLHQGASAAAALELAEAHNDGAGLLLRRHYAFGQYQRNDFFRHLDVVLRYTLSASDRSGQGVAFFTWNAGNHLQLFALFAGMNGSAETEFARYLRYQAQLGLRVFLH